LQKSVLLAAERIKRLEVQGARNVAITAIKAIEEEAKESKAKQKGEFLRELSEAKDILFASRETEPFMRNAIRYVMHAVEKSDEKKVKELVDLISSVSKQFLEGF
jgi:Translation initiation factor 2B subunit, eIF-2B alpha/beta/delta family